MFYSSLKNLIMQKKKLILTPPSVFTESSLYLEYISKLVADKSISIQLIKSIPLVVNNPKPLAIVGEGLSAPQVFIQGKMIEMHADHLAGISEYFTNRSIESDLTVGYKSLPELSKEELNITDCLMWTLEVSSEDSLWNELFGTKETELAKQLELPTLCIPSNVKFSKPETLLIISKDDTNIETYVPVEIINRFNLQVTLMIDNDAANIDQLVARASTLKLNKELDIVKADFVDGKDSLQNYVTSANPSWIAYHNFDKSLVERAFNMNTNNFILSAQRPVMIL